MMTSIYRWARDVWCRCVFALRGRAWLPAYVAGRWVRRGRPECDILSVGGGVHLLREGDGWSARRKGQWFFPRFLAVRAGAPTVKGQTLINEVRA